MNDEILLQHPATNEQLINKSTLKSETIIMNVNEWFCLLMIDLHNHDMQYFQVAHVY